MTTLAKVERNYGQLGPDERFRLWALAQARGDAADSRRLGEACPMRTYTMRDSRFGDRVHGLFEIGEMFILALTGLRGEARRDEAVTLAARALGDLAADLCALAYQHGWEDAQRSGKVELTPPPDGPAGPWWQGTGDRWCEKMAQPIASAGWRVELASFWAAADGWARDTTGAGAAVLLAGLFETPHVRALVEWAETEAAGIDPDPALELDARASTDDLWRKMVPGA